MRALKTLDQFITEDYNTFSDFLVLNEGGAYGHGRTHSHEHGATAHDH